LLVNHVNIRLSIFAQRSALSLVKRASSSATSGSESVYSTALLGKNRRRPA